MHRPRCRPSSSTEPPDRSRTSRLRRGGPGPSQRVGKVANQGCDLRGCCRRDNAARCPMCLCRCQKPRRGALTWRGGERSPRRQGATRTAQGPSPLLCSPSPQVKLHVTDFADPLGAFPVASCFVAGGGGCMSVNGGRWTVGADGIAPRRGSEEVIEMPSGRLRGQRCRLGIRPGRVSGPGDPAGPARLALARRR
jgi:hypothetical protein